MNTYQIIDLLRQLNSQRIKMGEPKFKGLPQIFNGAFVWAISKGRKYKNEEMAKSKGEYIVTNL